MCEMLKTGRFFGSSVVDVWRGQLLQDRDDSLPLEILHNLNILAETTRLLGQQ